MFLDIRRTSTDRLGEAGLALALIAAFAVGDAIFLRWVLIGDGETQRIERGADQSDDFVVSGVGHVNVVDF